MCHTMSINNMREQYQSINEDKILLQPFNYILQVPGKKIRSELTKAFNHWLNITPEMCHIIGEVVQMLHNASLLIDDIEDSSCLRRGVPVAHHIFGVASTINTANYVYFLGLEKLLKLGKPEATVVYAETGGLFGLAVRLMQLFSDNKSDFTMLIGIMGLYFQIRDDYANLRSDEYTNNKGYCEDLTEGKFSYPIIHAIRSHPEDPQMINIIRQRTQDVEIKKYSVDLMEKLGSFEYTRKTLEELDQEARVEIGRLGGNPHLIAVLDELKTW
ncbi:terpene synthase-like isoform X3 [Tachypleus tridentatus]|uniref:terpene synthase-like isoform X3 n=1 Tax=Tachypleus tridentatus TaxID=6853 RepID=UPI003FD34FE4